MRQRELPLLALVLAVALGIQIPFAGRKSGPPSPAAIATTATPQTPPETRPTIKKISGREPQELSLRHLDLLCKHTGKATRQEFPQCLDTSTRINSVIASIPNPLHTHLGLVFDRTIDAIQSAAASKSYLLYMRVPPQISQPSDLEPSAFVQEGMGVTPGILVFRKASSGTTRDYLIVFLVPESPSVGINWSVFWAAEKAIAAIDRKISLAKSCTPPETLWFAGPLYSGSVEGPNYVNMPAYARPRRICAFSGTVTNFGLPSGDDSDGCPPSKEASPNNSEAWVPQFLQASDKDAIGKLLCNLGYNPGEVALLTEEGTEYGRLERNLTSIGCKGESSNGAGILFLHFPREISHLRNAYAGDKGQYGTTSGQLPVNWRDSSPETGDKLPTFGGPQTTLSQEAVLAALASSVKARGIKLLGILATDPWDVAFLIRSFRDSCPDVRLFVREADLLYLRTSDVGLLNGVLVVNNFPLILQNQFWTSSNAAKLLISFPSGVQEAQYNAFATLLNKMGQEAQAPSALEDGWPQPPSSKPLPGRPLWLAITGTTGYFPVSILNEASILRDGHNPVDLRRLDVGRPPIAAILVWMLFAVIGLIHGFGLLHPGAVPSAFKEEFDCSEGENPEGVAKAFLHVAALLLITSGSVMSGSAFLYFWHAPYEQYLGPFSIHLYKWLACAVFLVMLFLLNVAARHFWRGVLGAPHVQATTKESLSESSGVGRKISGYLAFCSMAPFAAPVIWWGLEVFWQNFDNTFLHFRDLQLSSGVAPLLPILLLLVITYIGVWIYLRRLAFLDYGTVTLPEIEDGVGAPSHFNDTAQAITKWMVRLPKAKYWVIMLLMFVGIGLAFRPWATMDTFEPNVKWILIYCYGLPFLVLLLNWFRLIGIWRELRKILRHLEALPLRWAFNRLPKQSTSPIWGWQVTDDEFLPVTEAVENLQGLVRADKVAAADLEGVIRDLGDRTLAYEVGGKDPAEEPLRQEERPSVAIKSAEDLSSKERKILLHHARDAMNALIEKLRIYLTDYWSRGVSGLPKEKDQEKIDPAELKFVLAENIVALRFFSYIRYVVTEMRHMLFFAVVAVSLLYISLHTYALQGVRFLDLSFVFLFLFLAAGVIWILAQMERNPLLSRLQGTDAGTLGRNFYIDIARYGIVPVLTIVFSQVTWISNLLVGWSQPAVDAVR